MAVANYSWRDALALGMSTFTLGYNVLGDSYIKNGIYSALSNHPVISTAITILAAGAIMRTKNEHIQELNEQILELSKNIFEKLKKQLENHANGVLGCKKELAVTLALVGAAAVNNRVILATLILSHAVPFLIRISRANQLLEKFGNEEPGVIEELRETNKKLQNNITELEGNIKGYEETLKSNEIRNKSNVAVLIQELERSRSDYAKLDQLYQSALTRLATQ